MGLRIFIAMACVLAALTDLRANEPGAWWDICDSCVTEEDFHHRALQVPQPYTEVYVTNSSTNETQYYQRTILLDDLWGEHRITITAYRQSMSTQELQAFAEAVENSGVVFVSIGRDSVDGWAPSGRESVGGDLESGRLSSAFLSGLRTYLLLKNFLGTTSQISTQTSINLGILSYDLQVDPNRDLRSLPLVIKVNYPSGSTLQITLSPDFSSWSELEIRDDAGAEIPVEDPNDPSGISPVAPFDGIEMYFDTPNTRFIRRLTQALSGGGYSCTSRITGGNGINVICSPH